MSSNQIEILFQNTELLVVNKEAGVSVHNNEDPQNLLLALEKQLSQKKLFPVHRLDKETSGVQILALNSEAAHRLAEEFQSRSVKKIYLGILRGQMKQAEGLWNRPLTDKAEGRKNPAGVSSHRVHCETRFRVLQGSKYFSFCEFDLLTGRQHQIRKHAALANHPLVGDPRYGEPKYNGKIAEMYTSARMFLHCSRVEILGFKFQAPTPKEFELMMPKN